MDATNECQADSDYRGAAGELRPFVERCAAEKTDIADQQMEAKARARGCFSPENAHLDRV